MRETTILDYGNNAEDCSIGEGCFKIGFSVNNDDRELKKKILECIVFKQLDERPYVVKMVRYTDVDYYEESVDLPNGSEQFCFAETTYPHVLPRNLNNVFGLINMLFPGTYMKVFCEDDDADNGYWHNEEEKIFDPVRMICYDWQKDYNADDAYYSKFYDLSMLIIPLRTLKREGICKFNCT